MKRSYLAGLILMIVLLYPLSFGPVMRIASDPPNRFTQATIERTMAIYDPLLSVPILNNVLSWYATICTRHYGTDVRY